MALSNAQISFKLVFDTDQTSATVGKFLFTDDTDYVSAGVALADVMGGAVVVAPDGNTSVISITQALSLTNNAIDIPKDANGQYMEGTYDVNYVVSQISIGQSFNANKTSVFCPLLKADAVKVKNPIPSISIVHDCFCLKITSTDNTVYGTPTTQVRTHDLYNPPTIAPTTPVVTTNNKVLIYTFAYTGAYTTAIDTELTYVDGWFTTNVRVEGEKVQVITCDLDFCGLVKCFNNFMDNMFARAGRVGGFDRLSIADQEDFFKVVAKKEQWDSSLKCGEYTNASTYYSELTALLQCDCSCPSDDTPVLVDPYCAGGAGASTSTVVAAGTGISVSVSVVGLTTTYTVTNTATATTVTLVLDQENFNSAITYGSVISITSTGVNSFEISLEDPEAWQLIVNATDPVDVAAAGPFYDATPGSEILSLGKAHALPYPTLPGANINHAKLTPTSYKTYVRRNILGNVVMRGIVIVDTFIAGSLTVGVAGPNPVTYYGILVPICTLPEEFRPDDDQVFPVNTIAAEGYIYITPNGDVVAQIKLLYLDVTKVSIPLDVVDFNAVQ